MSAVQPADEDRGLDERTGGGIFHRARYLKGWRKHLHGYACPVCGTTCHDRENRDHHDAWHRADDERYEDETENREELEAQVIKIRGQMELMTELLGPALAEMIGRREAAGKP